MTASILYSNLGKRPTWWRQSAPTGQSVTRCLRPEFSFWVQSVLESPASSVLFSLCSVEESLIGPWWAPPLPASPKRYKLGNSIYSTREIIVASVLTFFLLAAVLQHSQSEGRRCDWTHAVWHYGPRGRRHDRTYPPRHPVCHQRSRTWGSQSEHDQYCNL